MDKLILAYDIYESLKDKFKVDISLEVDTYYDIYIYEFKTHRLPTFSISIQGFELCERSIEVIYNSYKNFILKEFIKAYE